MFLFTGEFVYLKEVDQSGHIVNLSVMPTASSTKLLRVDLLCSKSSRIHTYDVLDLYYRVNQIILTPERSKNSYGEIHKLASIYLSNIGFDFASPAKRNLLIKCCEHRESALKEYEEIKPTLFEEARILLDKEAKILKSETKINFESIIYSSRTYEQVERLISNLLINDYLKKWFYKYLQTESEDILRTFYDKIKLITYPRDSVLSKPLKDLTSFLSKILNAESDNKFIF